MSDLATEVRRRADHRCEYCLLPQALYRRPFHIEHIIAKQHGGASHPENLALACWQCNLKKGPNLTGIDPEAGQITRLFHPRQDTWAEHFQLQQNRTNPERMEIVGLISVGRATVRWLDLNDELRQALRYELWR